MERGRTDILNAVIRNITFSTDMDLALQDRGKISESRLGFNDQTVS